MVNSVSGKPRRARTSRVKQPVVAHVVNGKNHRYAGKLRIRLIAGAQQHRNQRALPIVAVDHLGHPELFRQFYGCPRELREALGIVGIILSRHAVELIAIEILGVVDEEILHSALPPSVGDRRETQRGAHRHGHALDHDVLDRHVPITGQHHGHVVSLRHQSLGQRFDYVGQAARLAERQTLGCNE